MKIEINITPMALKNGVLGLPIKCCGEWDAMTSISGKFVYADRTADITFTAKHIDYTTGKASAWQFTVNNAVQFATLKLDGVNTYAEGKMTGEKLVCDIVDDNVIVILTVTSKILQPATNATNKIRELLMQGIRPTSIYESKAPQWNAPSSWIEYSDISKYGDVNDCLYLWYGKKQGEDTTYLYVGIVGDTNVAGVSKRTLTQRLKEEKKAFNREYGIEIKKFRFCSLNNTNGFPIPELLKTVEMSEITIMTSLFSCENARDNIDPLFFDKDIMLLNKMTSYKYVK